MTRHKKTFKNKERQSLPEVPVSSVNNPEEEKVFRVLTGDYNATVQGYNVHEYPSTCYVEAFADNLLVIKDSEGNLLAMYPRDYWMNIRLESKHVSSD